MSYATEMADLRKKRQALLDWQHREWNNQPVVDQITAAVKEVDQKINQLAAHEARQEAGLPPLEEISSRAVPASPPLRLPPRMYSNKTIAAALKNGDGPDEDLHPDPEFEAEIQSEFDYIGPRVEEAFWDIAKSCEGGDQAAAFTVGQYRAILLMLIKTQAELYALATVGRKRRQVLEDRVGEIEKRPQLKYCGVWQAERKYVPGEFVSHGGAMWHCQKETASRPGDGDTWKLAVKSGRDGKDATR